MLFRSAYRTDGVQSRCQNSHLNGIIRLPGMAYTFCCLDLRGCFGISSNFDGNPSNRRDQNGAECNNREPILLDTNYMGHEVVIVKNGIRLCGNGGTIASAPINQNKAYWEVKVQQTGIF